MPVMSAGIRSGVNWMRLNDRSRICASVLISSVLASPGTPVIRQWPPVNSAISTWSITASWPTMTLRISARMRSRPCGHALGDRRVVCVRVSSSVHQCVSE